MRFNPDITRHRFADSLRATRHDRAAVHLFRAHDARVRVIHGRRRLDVMTVEGPREPEVNEFWCGSAHGDLGLLLSLTHIL